MANEQNLRPYGTIPEEEHKALSSKGGKASGEARRKAKNMREAAQVLLSAALTDSPETQKALEILGLEADQQGALLLAALQKGKAGDIEAARFVRDTSGQAPSQMVELGGIDGKPIQQVDLSSLTNEQLQELLQKQEKED